VGKVPITVMGYRCERCGHGWAPRVDAEPRVCPKCKSPYWNRARRRADGRGSLVPLRGVGKSRAGSLAASSAAQPPGGFWTLRSFEDLAAEQGIEPLKDWDAFVGGWPEGADFDAFLEAIRESRKS
jgi:hypothetical protein